MDALLKRHEGSRGAGEGAAGVGCLETRRANTFVAAAILLSAVQVGVGTQLKLQSPRGGLSGATGIAMPMLEALLLVVFWAEFILRARSRHPCSTGGLFDGCVNLCDSVALVLELAGVPAGALPGARALRLLRVPLLLACGGGCGPAASHLWAVYRAAAWAVVALALVACVGTLLCASVLGLSDVCSPEGDCLTRYFGSLGQSLLAQLDLALFGGWESFAAIMLDSSWAWSLYIVAFALVANFALIRGLTGVSCAYALRATRRGPARSESDQARERFRESLWMLFKRFHPQAARVGLGDCFDMLTSEAARPLLREMRVMRPTAPASVATVYDEDGKGFVTVDDWLSGTLRLRGTLADEGSRALQERTLRGDAEVVCALQEAELELKQAVREAVKHSGSAMLGYLDGLRQTIREDLGKEPIDLRELGSSMGKAFVASETPDVAGLCAQLETALGRLLCTAARGAAPAEPPLPAMCQSVTPAQVDISMQTDDDDAAADADADAADGEDSAAATSPRPAWSWPGEAGAVGQAAHCGAPAPAAAAAEGAAQSAAAAEGAGAHARAQGLGAAARSPPAGSLARSALRSTAGPQLGPRSPRERPARGADPGGRSVPGSCAAGSTAAREGVAAVRGAALVQQVRRLHAMALRLRCEDEDDAAGPPDLQHDRAEAAARARPAALGMQAGAALEAFAAEHGCRPAAAERGYRQSAASPPPAQAFAPERSRERSASSRAGRGGPSDHPRHLAVLGRLRRQYDSGVRSAS